MPVEQSGQIMFLKQFISMASYHPLRTLISMVIDSRFSPSAISKLDPENIFALLNILINVSQFGCHVSGVIHDDSISFISSRSSYPLALTR
jgi:hypothetical protein